MADPSSFLRTRSCLLRGESFAAVELGKLRVSDLSCQCDGMR